MGVDRICIAGGTVKTFEPAVKCLKPGSKIGNVNYLGSGDYVNIPRVEWGVGMGHKDIRGGLMPGGRLRMEKLSSLVTAGKLDLHPECTHIFHGWDHMVVMNILLRPLMAWAARLQKRERKLQDILAPQIREIKRELHGAEQHAELTELYRRYAYHPVYAVRSNAGLFIQLPFLIAAYAMLSSLELLEG